MKKEEDKITETIGKKTPTYFKPEEFICKCGCGEGDIDPRLLEMLNKARDYAGIPFIINSGVRCKKHNAAVGGVANSPHVGGFAADIKATTGHDKFLIVKACMHAGFNRIGVGKTFIHVDVDDRANKVQDTLWLY